MAKLILEKTNSYLILTYHPLPENDPRRQRPRGLNRLRTLSRRNAMNDLEILNLLLDIEDEAEPQLNWIEQLADLMSMDWAQELLALSS